MWAGEREQSTTSDPFVLASSEVVDGEFWVLVCLTGKWTSAGRSGSSDEQLGGLGDLTATGRTVSLVMRLVIALLAVILGYFLIRKAMNNGKSGYRTYLSLLEMLASLLLYLPYVNHN